MNKIKTIDHKDLWFNSLIGMTLGFMSTLIIGTIIGMFGLYSNENIFITIKKIFTFVTPFGIGVGIGIKTKQDPLKILSIGLGTFIVSRSMFIPHYLNDSFEMTSIKIDVSTSLFYPGDVFAAWLSATLIIYILHFYNLNTSIEIFLIPLLGIATGLFLFFWLPYLTTLITISMEWAINNTINDKLWLGLLLAPLFGLLMGLALSLPTSSAAIAFALGFKGDAAVIAIAATSAQMISFGVLTYQATQSFSKAFAVGFGTSMLQINNYVKKPILLLIPSVASMLSSVIALGAFHGQLSFDSPSTTSGMGTCSLYGQIFTLKENGWTNKIAWLNILLIQLILPFVFTVSLGKIKIQKFNIQRRDMIF